MKLDLSAEEQAILAGGGPNAPDASGESAPGAWEVSDDPGAHTTSNDQAPQIDSTWAYGA